MLRRASRKQDKRFNSLADEFDYKLIYVISFAVFFAAAVASTLTQWAWQSRDADKRERKSILEKARSDASSAVAFSFMQ
jgi:hypothetical protein